ASPDTLVAEEARTLLPARASNTQSLRGQFQSSTVRRFARKCVLVEPRHSPHPQPPAPKECAKVDCLFHRTLEANRRMCRHVHSEPSATSQLPVDRPVSSPEVAFSFLRSSSAPDLLVLLGIVHQLPSMRVEFCQFFGFTITDMEKRKAEELAELHAHARQLMD